MSSSRGARLPPVFDSPEAEFIEFIAKNSGDAFRVRIFRRNRRRIDGQSATIVVRTTQRIPATNYVKFLLPI